MQSRVNAILYYFYFYFYFYYYITYYYYVLFTSVLGQLVGGARSSSPTSPSSLISRFPFC